VLHIYNVQHQRIKEHKRNDTDMGKLKYLEKNLSHCQRSLYPWTSLRLNLGLNAERLVTNCHGQGTITMVLLLCISLATKCTGLYRKCGLQNLMDLYFAAGSSVLYKEILLDGWR
jgi:hypothetical protein